MFGIGGGELIFIMFIVLMLFGSDKIPDIARTLGKTIAQVKNATNDIKAEIQKGAQESNLGKDSLAKLTNSISSEINKTKEDLLEPLATVSDESLSLVGENKKEDGNDVVLSGEIIEGTVKRQG